jgi:hypothetical protein
MIYGNLRSIYSPGGKEYVTRWNPLAAALMGESSGAKSGAEMDAPKRGEFGSGMSSGAESGDAGDNSGAKGGGKGENYSGTSQDGRISGPNLGGYGVGGTLSTIGSGLGLATGLTGAGLVGNAIGTGIDTARANTSIGPGGNQIGLGGYLSGVLNNSSFGMLGDSIGSQWGGEIGRQSSVAYGGVDPQAGYDVGAPDPFGPGGTLADPYGGVDPNAGAAGGVGGSTGNDFSGANNGEAGLGGYYSRGGKVDANDLHGPNPPGPDDGYGGLDHGEFVLRAAAAEKLGPEILEKLNNGEFRKSALVKALLGK